MCPLLKSCPFIPAAKGQPENTCCAQSDADRPGREATRWQTKEQGQHGSASQQRENCAYQRVDLDLKEEGQGQKMQYDGSRKWGIIVDLRWSALVPHQEVSIWTHLSSSAERWPQERYQ